MQKNYFRSDNANSMFKKLAKAVMLNPDFIVKPRGWSTREMHNVTICITNPFDRLITNFHRKTSFDYLVGEWIWYERGIASLNEISYYSKFWNQLSDSGLNIASCYGKRLFREKTANNSQWEMAKKNLLRDKSTRRATMFLCERKDLNLETKDMPCTLALQFLIRNNSLYLTTYMRSNDLVFGFTYDQAIFTLFQEKMLLELKEDYPSLKMGTYTHVVTSLHVYEKHFELLSNVLKYPDRAKRIKMPRMVNISDISKLVKNEEILRNAKENQLLNVSDPLCLWCQKRLIRFSAKKNNKDKIESEITSN